MSVNELFNSLNIHANNSEFEKVFQIGQSLLSKKVFDKDVFKNCIKLIIENDKYSVGYKLIEQLEKKKQVGDLTYLAFEKLYIFYKLNLNDRFEKLFNKLSIEEFSPLLKRSLLHLKAQQFYKLGLYNNALEIYKILINHDSAGLYKFDDLDLKINETAIRSQQQLFVTEMSSTTEDITDIDNTTSYDLLFNESLIEFNERNFKKALKLLNLAKNKSENFHKNESLLDNFLESGVMYLQISYIYQLLNEFESAQNILNDFYSKFSSLLNEDTNNNINVQLLRLIYLNNNYALKFRNEKFNSFEILKDGKFTNLVSSLNDKNKLLNFQYNLFKRNESIFNFKINKKISITKSLNYNNNSNDEDAFSFETFKKNSSSDNVIDDNENYDLTILALASLQESKIELLEDLNMDELIKDRKIPKLYYRYLINKLEKASSSKHSTLDLQKIVAGSLLSIQLLINNSYKDEVRLNSSLNLGIQLLERIIFNENFFTSKITMKYYGTYSILLSLYEHTLNKEKYELKFSQIYNLIYDRFFMIPITNKYQYNFLKKINFEMVQLLNSNNIEDGEEKQKISQMLKKLLAFNNNSEDDELINVLLAQMEQKQQQNLTGKLIPINKLMIANVNELVDEEALQKLFNEHTSSLAAIRAKRNQQASRTKHVRKRKNPQHQSKSEQLDSERWIPLKDRSYYKVSKKDKKKMKNATQGGSVDNVTEESGISNNVAPAASGKKNKKNKKKGKK